MNLKDFYAKYGKNLYEIMIPITHFKERKRKNMGDRFKELSSKALEELTQVFGRMDDSTVRELLEEIKKTKRIFLLAAGREGLATKAFAMRLMDLGRHHPVHRRGRFDDLRLRFCQCGTRKLCG